MSEHFSLAELTFSQTALRLGIDNTPGASQIDNLNRLCLVLLEPIRTLLNVPIHVDSGYRSPAINHLVGGASSSAHMDGRAADLVPIGMDLKAAFDLIHRSSLPFDQLIIECNAWIHAAVAPDNTTPRLMAMTASGTPGNWTYTEVA